MRVMVLSNPVAGAGRAGSVSGAICRHLEDHGHEVIATETSLAPPETWLDGALADVDAIAVVGGDGAMRLAGAGAGRTGTPIYHVPTGTENLFARAFGMDVSPRRLLHALERRRVQPTDLGVVNDGTFLLMTSIGFDANVVRDLASRRRGAISHLSYLPPIARQLLRWAPSRITIIVDDETVVDDAPGCVIVANSSEYAGRFDPALHASMRDGELDVVFLPVASRRDLARWTLACLRRRHLRDDRLVYRRGRAIEVRSDPPRPYQVDGDAPSETSGITDALRVAVCPGALPVLLP